MAKGTLQTQQYIIEPLQEMVKATADVYRQRLFDISWFMRILNETIAKQANREDECTGRFWEGRFKSQALLDEAALAACMAYVDLNPVRAKMAATPESSDYTSIQQRIKAAIKGEQPQALLSFVGDFKQDMPTGIPFELTVHIALVEATGRCIRDNKRGYIENHQPAILTRLNIRIENWLILTTKFRTCFHGAVGHADALSEFCQHQELKKRSTLSICQKLFI